MTFLCAAIFVRDADRARRDIAQAAEAGADLVELRIDSVEDFDEDFSDFVSNSPVPCMVTCRPTWEGGQSELGDESRLAVLHSAALAGAGYIDVELATIRRSPNGGKDALRAASGMAKKAILPREGRAGLIVSSHDFSGRPTRLLNILSDINQSPADIAKIVWTARSIRDNLEAFEILQQKEKPTIAFCMGEAGLISRVLAKKFEAFLTFASLDSTSGTAAGQIAIDDMKRLYRWDAIGPQTSVHGVVGHPIAHSMSPAIHNAAFDAIGFDGIYLPMLVEVGYESFKAFMESFLAFSPLDLGGLSITIPHKENALRYLKEKGAEIEPLAQRIGALNTIVVADGTLRGFNTDYAAILDCIAQKLSISWNDLAGRRVAVIGAGGTGRTAVAALAHCGATVVVYNRTAERAQSLAEEFNGQAGKVVAASLEKLCDSCCEIYINTTSVGMHPNVDASGWGQSVPQLSADSLVFDTVYNPLKTKFLQQAQAVGAKTIDGVEMFVRQAAGQFSAWTGKEAPIEVMRKVVVERLSIAPDPPTGRKE